LVLIAKLNRPVRKYGDAPKFPGCPACKTREGRITGVFSCQYIAAGRDALANECHRIRVGAPRFRKYGIKGMAGKKFMSTTLNRSPVSMVEKKFEDKEVGEKLLGLEQNNDMLRKANQRILKQQMAVIEEQRLNVLFQMFGIVLHELNQPLTSILGNIELMVFNKSNQEKLEENINRIDDAGKRLSEIVKKIQNIGKEKNTLHENMVCPPMFNRVFNILSMIGSDEDFIRIESVLREFENIKLDHVKCVDQAFSKLAKEETDFVFIDDIFISLSEKDIIKKIKTKNAEVPVVMITEKNHETIAFGAIQDGVDEYCYKTDMDRKSLLRVINNAVEAMLLKRNLDSTLKKMAEISIRDKLTGLFQRRYFKEALEREIIKAKRNDTTFFICTVDIDNFKKINEICGRTAGDRVLKETSRFLQKYLRKNEVICRYGNESFVFILPDTPAENALVFCGNLKDAMQKHLDTNFSAQSKTTISTGITRFSLETFCTPRDLIEQTEGMLDKARKAGGNQLIVLESFSPERKYPTPSLI